MAEPFKEFLNAPLVRHAARHLQSLDARFSASRFERAVVPQLSALELKARALCIADALAEHLPADFGDATDLLTRALASAPANADAVMGDAAQAASREGLSGWILWPVGEYVARRGVEEPERALTFLHAMTQRFTAEFAIRPLIVAHEALVLEHLKRWMHDPSAHVRRLVSEGTRPRLPWGLQLKRFIADPSPCVPLLEHLVNDSSDYVRRSVANHLNDIAKDHPDRVVAFVTRHLPNAPEERRALLRHASRTLIKQGYAAALDAWGHGTPFRGQAELSLSPRRIALGQAVMLEAQLTATARTPQELVVDYVVHHVKANGETSPKVFKGWRLTLAPGETRVLTRKHNVKPITTRRYYAGRHEIALQINGKDVARDAFTLTLPR
ncbi:DNA alkylation repair protein [Gemmatimonas sp. UBA7669]|uniref:DNA alkylation repair protein n=1 Tax=Gemmatimonas sp. UBA7669 TaxID=1946568 RepID=UPI0025C261DD|nr:DNA alkylation repair protein [Gemmatimonas sp. UBA7669]